MVTTRRVICRAETGKGNHMLAKYEVTTDLDALRTRLCAVPQAPFGFDTEMSGQTVVGRQSKWLDWYSATLTGFSIAIGEYGAYVPVDHAEGGGVPLEAAKAFLAWMVTLCKDRRVWAHNWKAELQILVNLGIPMPYDLHGWYCDSQVAAWLAGWSTKYHTLKLKPLAQARGYGEGPSFEELARGRQARDIPVAEIGPYAARDAWLALRLGEDAHEELQRARLLEHFYTIDMPLVEVCRSIEAWGTPVDRPRVEAQSSRLEREAQALRDDFQFLSETEVSLPFMVKEPTGEFFKNGKPKLKNVQRHRPVTVGASVSNDRQVSRWCYEELKVWPTKGLRKNGAGHYPVDKVTLERFRTLPGLGGQLADLRLEWAWRDKLIKTYLQPLLRLPPQYADGLLHTSLHLTGTATQRFSSSNPNLQNVPSRTEEGRAIRYALRARPGWVFLIFDYSQIELRIMAHLSRDPEMMACYVLGIDIHQGTLEEIRKFWDGAKRIDAKTTNFSVIYRASAETLAVKMRSTVREAEHAIEAFYARFTNVAAYHDAAIAYAVDHNYARTIDGFQRPLDMTPKWNWKSRRKELPWGACNEAINTPVQGSAAGLTKLAMLKMWRRWNASGEYGVRVNLAGQEHDAIITEAREDFAAEAFEHMKLDMESALALRVPIIAEGGKGPSWAEAKAA